MTPAIAAPLAEMTPYLLQQSGLRASLLKTNFGFGGEDWSDLRQDMALDCLKRLPKFNPERGNWKGFVHGVVRNRAFVLASQQTRRSEFESRLLPEADACDGQDEQLPVDALAEDSRAALERGIDIRTVLASLPESLQLLAYRLSMLSIHAVCRQTGQSRQVVERQIAQIRTAFIDAGLSPEQYFGKGGPR